MSTPYEARQSRSIAAKTNRQKDYTLLAQPSTQALLCELMAAGATGPECAETLGVSTLSLNHYVRSNEALSDSVKLARIQGAQAVQDEALEYARQATQGDSDMASASIRAAESYARIVAVWAANMAPREFGALVKLGAESSGDIQVVVSRFEPPAPITKPLEPPPHGK